MVNDVVWFVYMLAIQAYTQASFAHMTRNKVIIPAIKIKPSLTILYLYPFTFIYKKFWFMCL